MNQIQQTMQLLAVTAGPTERSARATGSGATIMDRADLRSGYTPAEHLGRCERWVSTAKASHLIMSADVSHSA